VDKGDNQKDAAPPKGKRRTQRRLKKADIIDAILEAGGILSVAAENLKCARQTLYKRAATDPAIAAAIEEGRESLKDFAEGRLVELMRKDTGPGVTAIIFYLKTQAKERGYIESQTINVRGLTTRDLESMSDQELEDAERKLGGSG